MRGFGCVQAVGGEQEQGQNEQADNFAGAQRMLAKNFENIREQRDTRAKEDETDDVERIGVLLAIVGQMAIDEVETDEADLERCTKKMNRQCR